MKNPLQYLPKGAALKVGRATLEFKKNSPHIMFGAGTVGMVGTVVLASRATLKLDTVLQSIEDKKFTLEQAAANEDLPQYTEAELKRDRVVVTTQGALQVAKLYAPAVIVGVTSIVCLTGAHVTLNRRNAGLAAAYAAVDQAYKRYQKRVEEEYGEDKARELRYDLDTTVEKVVDAEGKKQKVTKKTVSPNGYSQYAKFFDQFCKDYSPDPEYNMIFLRGHQNYLNNLLQYRGHVFLNEVYDALGIERTRAGAVVGWVLSEDGDNYIDFGLFNKENERARDLVNGREGAILLDFNVDGVILDKLGKDN